MSPKSPSLETPFKRGEKVRVMSDVSGAPEGSVAKVRIINGLETWIRYWILLDDGTLVGHVDHDALCRLGQMEEWKQREADRQARANAEPDANDAAAETGANPEPSQAEGAAALIPAHLLERSAAAKARLLGT